MSKMPKCAALVATGGGLVLALASAGANGALLIDASTLNGGFESGPTTTSLSEWKALPGYTLAAQRQNNHGYAGAYSGILGGSTTSNTLTLAIDTAHTIHAGDIYDLEFQLRGASNATPLSTILWRLYYTADNTLSGTPVELATGTAATIGATGAINTSPYNANSFTTAAMPTAAAGKELFLSFQTYANFDSVNESGAQYARIDNVTLSTVPEPAVAGLAAAGLLMLRRRRQIGCDA